MKAPATTVWYGNARTVLTTSPRLGVHWILPYFLKNIMVYTMMFPSNRSKKVLETAPIMS